MREKKIICSVSLPLFLGWPDSLLELSWLFVHNFHEHISRKDLCHNMQTKI